MFGYLSEISLTGAALLKVNIILFTFPQEKLKGSLPLTAIEAVLELPGDTTSFKVTGGFTYPLILQASSKEKCQEWIKAIENG